jgi:hypothetical protein
MGNVFSFQLLTVGRRLPFVLKRIIRSQYVVAKEHVYLNMDKAIGPAHTMPKQA